MADKAKRVMLTPDQRVIKLKSELARAEAKASARANRETNKLLDKRTTLVSRINKLQDQVDVIDEQLDGGVADNIETSEPSHVESIVLESSS